jgi:septal ring factor EnvC (AmiA/AmiB activator)
MSSSSQESKHVSDPTNHRVATTDGQSTGSSDNLDPLKRSLEAKEKSIQEQNAELEDLNKRLASVRQALAENRAARGSDSN